MHVYHVVFQHDETCTTCNIEFVHDVSCIMHRYLHAIGRLLKTILITQLVSEQNILFNLILLFDLILYVHSTIFQLCGTVLPGFNQY